MLQEIQSKLLFPAPAPSYTEQGPLRHYDIRGYYCELKPGEYSFEDFKARLFWAGETPCIALPHRSSQKILVYAHANKDDAWRTHGLLEYLRDELGSPLLSDLFHMPYSLLCSESTGCIHWRSNTPLMRSLLVARSYSISSLDLAR